MGACYSTHGRRGKDPYLVCPANMPQPRPEQRRLIGGHQTQPALQKPYGGRYGFQAVSNPNEHDNEQSLNLISNDKEMANMNRFGFNKKNQKQSEMNPKTGKNNKDTLNSNKPSNTNRLKGPGSIDTLNQSKQFISYNPKDGEKWRMIDEDSSSAASDSKKDRTRNNSPAKSIKSSTSTIKDDGGAEEDIINANVAKPLQQANQNRNLNVSNLSDKKGNGSKLPNFSRIRGHFGRAHTAPNGDKSLSSSFSSSKIIPNQSGSAKKKHDDPSDKASTGSRFLRKGFFTRQKSVQDKSSHKLTSSVSVDSANIQSSCQEVPKSQTMQPLSPESKPQLPNLGDPVLQKKLVEKSKKLPEGIAPIAMIDSLETTSIGSIDTDDLMLDTDVHLDDYEEPTQNAPEVKKSARSRSRSRSGSRTRLIDNTDAFQPVPSNNTENKVEKKPPLLRRHTEGSVKKKGADRNSRNLENEPIQELASLLANNNLQDRSTRNPKIQKGLRPNSFPGPAGDDVTPAQRPSTLLRPPRSQPSIGDDEFVTVDAFTYRQLMQELTTTKTMLLKLKRLLYDDELSSPTTTGPFAKAMNGFKLGSLSQPTTPSFGEDSGKFQFLNKDQNEQQTLENLKQENAELRQQVVIQQHQVEEHERTIKLLQHQMTKYEHIDLDEGGKCFTHSSTQTEKLDSSAAACSIPRVGRLTHELSLNYGNNTSSTDQLVSSMIESGIDLTSPNSELQTYSNTSKISEEVCVQKVIKETCQATPSDAIAIEANAEQSSQDHKEDAAVNEPLIENVADEMTQSQIWEQNFLKTLEEEPICEDDDCLETMEDLDARQMLMDAGIKSPPRATEIRLEKYILKSRSSSIGSNSSLNKNGELEKYSVRPDLLKGVDHIFHDDSDQESIEITAKDYSSASAMNEEFTDALDSLGSMSEANKQPCVVFRDNTSSNTVVEKQSRDSGVAGLRSDCDDLHEYQQQYHNQQFLSAVCSNLSSHHLGAAMLDYSPSDTSSFSMAVISTEIDEDRCCDTDNDESDLPLDTPENSCKEFMSRGNGNIDESKSYDDYNVSDDNDDVSSILSGEMEQIELSGKKQQDVIDSTFCIDHDIDGAGEELADPHTDGIDASSSQCNKKPSPSAIHQLVLEGEDLDSDNNDNNDKITRDMDEVEDCMNQTKDLNDAENYLCKGIDSPTVSPTKLRVELNTTYNGEISNGESPTKTSKLNITYDEANNEGYSPNKTFHLNTTYDFEKSMDETNNKTVPLNTTFEMENSIDHSPNKIFSSVDKDDFRSKGKNNCVVNDNHCVNNNHVPSANCLESKLKPKSAIAAKPKFQRSASGLSKPEIKPTLTSKSSTRLPTPGSFQRQLSAPGSSSSSSLLRRTIPRPTTLATSSASTSSVIGRGTSSRLPSLGIQRVNKTATSLKSFSVAGSHK